MMITQNRLRSHTTNLTHCLSRISSLWVNNRDHSWLRKAIPSHYLLSDFILRMLCTACWLFVITRVIAVTISTTILLKTLHQIIMLLHRKRMLLHQFFLLKTLHFFAQSATWTFDSIVSLDFMQILYRKASYSNVKKTRLQYFWLSSPLKSVHNPRCCDAFKQKRKNARETGLSSRENVLYTRLWI